MDELVISDKRYISTRRAAREHRYHSDYIGQLVRGGKIVGKKIGRSWYVEEESLLNYFSGEQGKSISIPVEEPKIREQVNDLPIEAASDNSAITEKAEILGANEEIITPSIEVPLEVPEQISEQIVEQSIPLRVISVEEDHPPAYVSNKGLTYLSDETEEKTLTPVVTTMPSFVEPSVIAAPRKKISSVRTILVLGVSGLLVFGAALAVGKYMVGTVGTEGQTASTGYLFQL